MSKYHAAVRGSAFLEVSARLPYRLYSVSEVSLLLRVCPATVRRELTAIFPPLRRRNCTHGQCYWTDDQVLGMIDYVYAVPPERMDELKRRISIFSKYPADSTPSPAVPKRDPKPKP